MNGIVFAVLCVATAMASEVINVQLDDQKHSQQGEAGAAVTGSYSFVDADGVTHTTTYIADEKGYRVIGRSSSGVIAAIRTPVAAPAPVPIPVPAPVPVPVAIPAPAPVPVALPAPKPVKALAPAPLPKPVVLSSPAPAPVRVVSSPAPAPVVASAPTVQDANGGLVYYVVNGGNFPFGGQFGTPVASPVATSVPSGVIKTAELKTSAVQSPVQSPVYYVVSGAPGSLPIAGAGGQQQIFSLPSGAKTVAGQQQIFSLPAGARTGAGQQQIFSLPAGAQQIPFSGFPFNFPFSGAPGKV